MQTDSLRTLPTAATLGLWLVGVCVWCTLSSAEDTVTWLKVTPEQLIQHAVSIRGPFTTAQEPVKLVGPEAILSTASKGIDSFIFTSYAIVNPARTLPQGVNVLLPADDATMRVEVGPIEFLLLPAQQLTDGQPEPPREPTAYEVRPVLNPAALNPLAALTPAAARLKLLAASHLCLPAEYFHHFEHTKIENAGRGLVLFSTESTEMRTATSTKTPERSACKKVSIVDDFGTNQLLTQSVTRVGVWVRIQILAVSRPESQ
ncbi:MAG: hypothetical protein CK530_10080 [Planctomycetaceae bacterium]|nr:MAG: hypothetical protein CK530_10080 [Planctomycetaceae bacterium]